MQEPEKGERPSGRAYAELMSDVLTDVQRREAAARAAARPRNPRLHAFAAAALSLVLVGVVGLNYVLLTRPPEGLPPAEQEIDLRYVVAGVAEAVEAFRETSGRLPTPAEMSEYLEGDDDVRYEVAGEGFRIVARAEGVELTYDGSLPLETWLAARTYDFLPARRTQ